MGHDISDEQNEAHFRQHAQKIVEVMSQALVDLFDSRGPTLNYDPNEPMIQLDNGIVEIRPGVHEQRSLVRRASRPAFDIITYKHTPASRWQPEDWEDVPLATTLGVYNTGQRALVEWFNIVSNGWFDAAGEAADHAETERLLADE